MLFRSVRKNINVTVVINDNAAFAQGRANIRRLYGNRPGDPLDINAFARVDFAAVARAYGAEGLRVERAQDIAPALQQALRNPRVTVVDVKKATQKTIPYKEMERYCRDRTASPLK